MKPNEIYDYVTNKIIHILEQKLEGQWHQPWISVDADSEPNRNPVTHQYYRGINQFILSLIGIELGFLKNEFATYKQINSLGGSIKKGEKALPVVFYKTAFIDQNKNYYSIEAVKAMAMDKQVSIGLTSIPILKLYQVFNLYSQTIGLPEQYYEIPQAPKVFNTIEKNLAAENLIISTGANIEYKMGNKAAYNRKTDIITLPIKDQFNSQEELYATALHELVHWSGAENRLNRKKGQSFGDSDYSKEEIIAELASSLLCCYLGFEKQITNSAAYIKGWLTVLKDDNKAIFKASAEAQKACDYIIGGGEYKAIEEQLFEEEKDLTI